MIHDLLYFGLDGRSIQLEFEQRIKKEFPDVILENADNDIKGHRTSVKIDDSKKDDYYIFVIGNGFWNCSFNICMLERDYNGEKYLETLLPILEKKYPK